MKTKLLVLSMSMALSAGALDNTISNDFWVTTGYVNATPATTQVAVPLGIETLPLPYCYWVVCSDFCSYAPGFLLLFR